MAASLKIALHDVPGSEALTRIAEHGAKRLFAEFPSMVSCKLVAEKATGTQDFEVHVELLFPEEQIIFNRVANTAEAALNEALAAISAAKPVPIAA